MIPDLLLLEQPCQDTLPLDSSITWVASKTLLIYDRVWRAARQYREKCEILYIMYASKQNISLLCTSKKFLGKCVRVRRATQEVLKNGIQRYSVVWRYALLTSSEISSSRLPPGSNISLRYFCPRDGSRGSFLNTVAYMSAANTKEYVYLKKRK